MSVGRSETFVVWSEGHFESIIVSHPHSSSCPEMSGKPLNFLTPHFVGSDQMSSLSDVFSAFWKFLHALCLCKIFFHVLSQPPWNSKSIVAHGSPPDRSLKGLMTFFLGVELQVD